MITKLTTKLVQLKFRELCAALAMAEEEHGAPIIVYVGSGEQVCDMARLGAHHENELSAPGGALYDDGGSVVIDLTAEFGAKFEGGDW